MKKTFLFYVLVLLINTSFAQQLSTEDALNSIAADYPNHFKNLKADSPKEIAPDFTSKVQINNTTDNRIRHINWSNSDEFSAEAVAMTDSVSDFIAWDKMFGYTPVTINKKKYYWSRVLDPGENIDFATDIKNGKKVKCHYILKGAPSAWAKMSLEIDGFHLAGDYGEEEGYYITFKIY